MEVLPLASATIENIQVFSNRIAVIGFFGQHEVCLDDIGHIPQDGGSALLTVFIDKGNQTVCTVGLHGLTNTV
ncbi:hypothetical protein D3C76_1331220 [compost metagenome]